jgi:hypothetical protein
VTDCEDGIVKAKRYLIHELCSARNTHCLVLSNRLHAASFPNDFSSAFLSVVQASSQRRAHIDSPKSNRAISLACSGRT